MSMLMSLSSYFAVDHLVNTVSLGHTFYLEEVTDTTVFPHLLVRTNVGCT